MAANGPRGLVGAFFVGVLAAAPPEWKSAHPPKAALEGNLKALTASGEHGLLEPVMASHAGNTSEAFARIVGDRKKVAPSDDEPALHRARVPADARPARLPARAFAYDRDSPFGKPDRGLEGAAARGRIVFGRKGAVHARSRGRPLPPAACPGSRGARPMPVGGPPCETIRFIAPGTFALAPRAPTAAQDPGPTRR